MQTAPASKPATAQPSTAQPSPIPYAEPSGLRGVIGDGKFLSLIVVLLIAALGLNVSVKMLQLRFKKESVPMRQTFGNAMPRVMDQWVQVGKRDALEATMIDALGTEEYLFCTYLNARELNRSPETLVRDFEGKTSEEQAKLIAQYRRTNPLAVIDLSLTYYTGKADTVAHVPERCYVAGGFDPVDPKTETWHCDGRPVSVRHISFQNQSTLGASDTCNVAYFFNTNGAYESNSLLVRSALQDLFARYGYYAKVELMCVNNAQREDQREQAREASRKAMEDFLSVALPHIEKALPDWNQYKAKS